MAVMSNSLISGGGLFGPTSDSTIANVIDGGQMAFGPLLRNLDADTPLVLPPLRLVVLHVPEFFKYIPNGPEIFKAIMETHLIRMDGLNFDLNMETEGTPAGRDGQMLNVPTKQTRSQISPSGTWPEKLGNIIYKWGRIWMNAMRDIDTQASSMAGIISASTTLPPHVISMYAADLLFIQYDMTYRPENIVDAFGVTNFFPTSLGDNGFSLDNTNVTRPDRTFTFTGLVQHNNNTVNVARAVAAIDNIHTISYQDAHPIADTVESAVRNMGSEYLATNFMQNFVNNNGVVA